MSNNTLQNNADAKNRDKKNDDDAAYIFDLVVKSIKSIKSGTIKIGVKDQPAMLINTNTNRIDIDVLDPQLFKFTKEEQEEEDHEQGIADKLKEKLHTAKEFAHNIKDSEIDIFDELHTAKEFAHILTDNDMTITVSRKGKEAIILGKEAKPTVSKLVSRSDDVQIKSVKETAKLGKSSI